MLPSAHVKKRMSSISLHYFISIFILFHLTSDVSGHGRLIEPPSRSSMWRFGFKTKPNYNDNELFCGGYTVHFQRNGGKCGVCGDPWDAPSPRPNEAGGAYGKGIIVRNYHPGQVITSVLDITANHRGFFQFKICPHNNPRTVVAQDCLDRYTLHLADGSGTKYYPAPRTGRFSVNLRLPNHVSCSQCVFQWTYTAGNNWGRCENGTSKVGCGPQETFRGCADIAIGASYNNNNDIPSDERPDDKPSISAIPTRRTTYRPRTRPTRLAYRPSKRPYTNRRVTVSPRPATTRRPVSRRPRPSRPTQYYNVPGRKYTTRRPSYISRPTPYRPIYTPRPTPYRPHYTKPAATKKARPTYKPKAPAKSNKNFETQDNKGGCKAVGVWQSISGIASWCDSNCSRGYCPSSHCDCS